MNRKLFFKLSLMFGISSLVLFTFNNCGDSFKMLASPEQIAHEASTMSKQVYINGATDNIFYTGRDLTFSADMEGIDAGAMFEWSYSVNGMPQGCTILTVSVPSMYKLNCPSSTGELSVSLMVRSSSGDVEADPVKYTLTQAPAVPPTETGDVQFTIPAGTGKNSWNTVDNPIQAKVGQKIVITNADSVAHRMHTGGTPCPHGANILPGQTGVCIVNAVFNGNVYDHNNGTASKIYIVTTP